MLEVPRFLQLAACPTLEGVPHGFAPSSGEIWGRLRYRASCRSETAPSRASILRAEPRGWLARVCRHGGLRRPMTPPTEAGGYRPCASRVRRGHHLASMRPRTEAGG